MLVRLLFAAVLSFAPSAAADELDELLIKGSVVRLETDAAGKLSRCTCIADIDAPADIVWKILTDFESYRFFMPRMDKLEVSRLADGSALMKIRLDTPLSATVYTNRLTADAARRTLDIRQVDGDLKGSNYSWRVVPRGAGRSRVYHTGVVKNFSAIAQTFEDEQQTITVGVNVVSLMAPTNALKNRAEAMARREEAAAAARVSATAGVVAP